MILLNLVASKSAEKLSIKLVVQKGVGQTLLDTNSVGPFLLTKSWKLHYNLIN